MAHFYGLVTHADKAKPATAVSTKARGINTIAASWEGAIRVDVTHKDGADHYVVALIEWPSGAIRKVLASGRMDGQS